MNARELLPVNKYFMGEILPPHLSPFIDPERDQQYIPPEARGLYDENELEAQHKIDEKISEGTNEDSSDDDKNNDVGEEKEEGRVEIIEKVSFSIYNYLFVVKLDFFRDQNYLLLLVKYIRRHLGRKQSLKNRSLN